MDKKEFDRTRDFGTIYGEPGLGYEQDGVLYAPDYKAVEEWSTPEKIAQEKRQAQTRKAREAALAAKREAREKLRILKEES